jgi:hypothetical protein
MRVAARLALLLLPVWLPVWLFGADEPAAKQGFPPAAEIIVKAVAWAKWHEEQKFYRNWTADHLNTAHSLTDSGETKSTATRLYKVYPLGGEQFYELVRHNGEPLSQRERRKEVHRKREFLEQATKKAAGQGGGSDDEGGAGLKFNQDLVSRYRAEVVGTEAVGSRQAYVVRFEPNSGALPVRHRYDHVLNRSHGRLWIDREEFAVLKIEFELQEPVRLWAGLLGSVSRLRGRLTLIELGGGAWFYNTMELYMKGRILIKSFHEDRRLEWSNFQRIAPGNAP